MLRCCDYFVPDPISPGPKAAWDQERHDTFVDDYLCGFAHSQSGPAHRLRAMADSIEAACASSGACCSRCRSTSCIRNGAVKSVTVTLVSVFTAVNV